MASENRAEGQHLYATGDAATKNWFHRQWKVWPERADRRFTTNLSFHYGGVLAYRIEHGSDPDMSDLFRVNIAWFDKEGSSHD